MDRFVNPKMINMRIGWFIIVALFFAGCKKNKADAPANKSVSQLLTEKPWMISVAGFDDNDNGIIDPSENFVPDCGKDDTFTFNSDGTGSVQDNTTTCTPPDNN